ncbi:Protein of unknown function D [Prunus dulcis]|uniref:Probable magnesium transporter n=1 Tax=Prunus dulcis TaxID=3755 RepID=A0A4Y1QNG0_PRUDU|nr:Protein of unknown function D [Prunus dulcis]
MTMTQKINSYGSLDRNGRDCWEIANFAAYAFAPAILVTPLGALSIIVSAVLAHFVLEEKLHVFGVLGCALCVVGSINIVLHAPQEKPIHSVKQVWQHATQPGFIVYTFLVLIVVAVLIFRYVPRYGIPTWSYMLEFVHSWGLLRNSSIILDSSVGYECESSGNRSEADIFRNESALDTFNTAIIAPVYYVMFTIFTILASDWESQSGAQIVTELCGFITILSVPSSFTNQGYGK